jgi:sensor domain CHASE-containing protein
MDNLASEDAGYGFEARLRRRLAAMFWLLTGGLLALLVFALVWFSWDQDRRALAMSERTASSAIAARLQGMARTVTDYAVWDDAYEHVVAGFDREWIDGNIGPFTFESLGFERSFIVDRGRSPIYAMHQGKPLEFTDRLARLPAEIDALARNAIDDDAKAVASLLMVDGKPALVAIDRIAPSTSRFAADPAKVRVLVFVDYLDAQVLDEMAEIYSLTGLATGVASDGEASVPLIAANGRALGAIYWRQDQPGEETLKLVAPVAAVLALLLVFAGSRIMALVNQTVDQMMVNRRKAEDAIERARLALAAANAAKGDAESARQQLAEIEFAHHQLERLRNTAPERIRQTA